MHPDIKTPMKLKDGRTIYPFCYGKGCKELEEKGEKQLIRERTKEYEQMLAGGTLQEDS